MIQGQDNKLFYKKWTSGDVILNAPLNIHVGDIGAVSNDTEITNFNKIEIISTQGSVFIDGATITTSNSGSGLAGNIFINANDEIRISAEKDEDGNVITEEFRRNEFIGSIAANPSIISSDGNSGGIFIGRSASSDTSNPPQKVELNASTLRTTNTGIIGADAHQEINSGNISIDAVNSITLMNGSQLVTGTVITGNAGKVSINTSDSGSVTLEGIRQTDGIGRETVIVTDTIANGDAGDITINTGTLEVNNGARILARSSTTGNIEGDAGKIEIIASDSVTISSFEEAPRSATVGTDVVGGGRGDGNKLTITARSIDISDYAIVAASILNGSGATGKPGEDKPGEDKPGEEPLRRAQAGDVTLTATGDDGKVSVSNNSVVFSEVVAVHSATAEPLTLMQT